jgi:hypothetical protein
LKTVIIVFVVALFYSCSTGYSYSTGMRMTKVEFKPIYTRFSGTFANKSFKAKTSYTYNTSKDSISTILKLFEISGATSDSVTLEFSSEGVLTIQYYDGYRKRTRHFEGEFKSRGFYEIYIRSQSVGFPRIYEKDDFYRLRLALTNEGNLVIDKFLLVEQNLLIYFHIITSRHQFYFKTIK